MTTVFRAWAHVMEDVQGISKRERNAAQGFNFRGIDAVLNAVGPVLRTHGVIVVPEVVSHEAERYTTAKGGQMVNRVVEMIFKVIGPEGDHFYGKSYGEAADSGDKALSKAQSVALRTFLLQALAIPTDEPDPDASSHERVAPANVVDNLTGLRAVKETMQILGLEPAVVADRFLTEHGRPPAQASNDELLAFAKKVKDEHGN